MAKHDFTPEMMRHYFSYDPETGVLRWKNPSRINGTQPGAIAGCLDSTNHRRLVTINYKRLKAHHIIWAYQTGEWPTRHIDHVNRDPSDNRWCNLREATASDNQCNQGKNRRNTSGYKGVTWHKQSGKWIATIMRNNKSYWLGCFSTKEEARDAYIEASLKLHGEFSYYHQIRPSGAKR